LKGRKKYKIFINLIRIVQAEIIDSKNTITFKGKSNFGLRLERVPWVVLEKLDIFSNLVPRREAITRDEKGKNFH
jgi:hypothetical protein